jgi:integrase/recombinase XerD
MNSRAARVRVDGPLGRYADRFRIELARRGYKPSAAAGQLQLMAHLSRWLVDQDLAGADLTPAVTEKFLQARRAAGYGQWLSMRGLAPLLGCLRDLGFAPAEVVVAPASPDEVLLGSYRAYLVAERGLAPSTVRNYLEVARLFVSHRQASGQLDLGEVTAAQVCEFVVAGCRDRRVGSAKLLVVGRRDWLMWSRRRRRGPAVPCPSRSTAGRRYGCCAVVTVGHRWDAGTSRCSRCSCGWD